MFYNMHFWLNTKLQQQYHLVELEYHTKFDFWFSTQPIAKLHQNICQPKAKYCQFILPPSTSINIALFEKKALSKTELHLSALLSDINAKNTIFKIDTE